MIAVIIMGTNGKAAIPVNRGHFQRNNSVPETRS